MNEIGERRYKLEDLKIGMTVKLSELSEIYDTHMLLENSERIGNKDLVGTLVLFGNNAEEYDKWYMKKKRLTPVYFDSAELLDGVVYDE